MTKEEKQLILKDVSARLPYGVMLEITSDGGMMEASYDMKMDAGTLTDLILTGDDFKPYLRPMASMTEKEKKDYRSMEAWKCFDWEMVDWYNKHHLDYRGLIPKGLALKAKEGMYEIE